MCVLCKQLGLSRYPAAERPGIELANSRSLVGRPTTTLHYSTVKLLSLDKNIKKSLKLACEERYGRLCQISPSYLRNWRKIEIKASFLWRTRVTDNMRGWSHSAIMRYVLRRKLLF